MDTNYKIDEQTAVEEVKAFVEFHKEDGAIEADNVKEDYPDVIKALRLGLLIFDENHVPTFTLSKPVKNDAGEVSVGTLTFKTRIAVSAQEQLAKGIDVKTDALRLINKFRAYYIGQPVAMLDKIGKFDFRVIDQITSVF